MQSIGVPINIELPGVGENMQEHMRVRVHWSQYQYAHTCRLLADVDGYLEVKDSVQYNGNEMGSWGRAFAFVPIETLSRHAESIHRRAQHLVSKLSATDPDPVIRGRLAQYKLLAQRLEPGNNRPTVELIYVPSTGIVSVLLYDIPHVLNSRCAGSMSDSSSTTRLVGFSVVMNHCFSRGTVVSRIDLINLVFCMNCDLAHSMLHPSIRPGQQISIRITSKRSSVRSPSRGRIEPT